MRLSERVAAIERDLAQAERLLEAVHQGRFFRAVRAPGRLWHDWRGRLGQALLHSPLHPLYARATAPSGPDPAYARWIAAEEPPLARSSGPLISVVMPVHDPRREWLEQAVDSVRRQTYSRWELCACDDASREPWVREFLSAAPGVRFVRSEENLGIAGATNRAGALAAGDYLAFLDQDDTLAPDALARVAEALDQGPADLVYTDQDMLDESGRRVSPMFKPDWSPELLLSCMYMGHLLVARRAAVERAGWLRPALDGAQDYDLALRIAEAGGAVRHVPRVLYHWRRHPGSSAASASAKSYTQGAGYTAVSDALARRGIPAEVENGPSPNTYRVWREAPDAPVSIVICSRNARLLARCLRGIGRRTAYPRREVVIVEHLAGPPRLRAPGARVIPYTGPFDFAAMNNLGARQTSGEVLVFLNDDVLPLDERWLAALAAQAVRPEVGVVGARLVYPGGAIQHAGMAVGIGDGTGHPQRDTFGAGYWSWWNLTREVSAVTGACMAVRKSVFEELGGFDTRFPVNFNDADLCLRAREAGYKVIYEAAALLRHDECRTRRPGVQFAERSGWERRWGEYRDPYYSPSLDRESEGAGLAR